MSKLPRVEGRAVVKALRRAGFEILRRKGSHHIMRHPDGRQTSVPVHAGKILPKGTILAILDDTGLSRADLQRLL